MHLSRRQSAQKPRFRHADQLELEPGLLQRPHDQRRHDLLRRRHAFDNPDRIARLGRCRPTDQNRNQSSKDHPHRIVPPIACLQRF